MGVFGAFSRAFWADRQAIWQKHDFVPLEAYQAGRWGVLEAAARWNLGRVLTTLGQWNRPPMKVAWLGSLQLRV